MQALYAPGWRVVLCDCEWIVRRADPSDDGIADEELYEVARGGWKFGERHGKAFDDVCVSGRWEFAGDVSEGSTHRVYKGGDVSEYFQRRISNPVRQCQDISALITLGEVNNA